MSDNRNRLRPKQIKFFVNDKEYELKEGDAYLVPADVPHGFVAIGETEAIDVFAPVKTVFPWEK